MKIKSRNGLVLGMSLVLAVASCKKDDIEDPIIPNEEEVITTLLYTLTPTGGGDNVVFSFQDLDADGPQDPTISVSGSLMANTQYTASLVLLNETVTPADTINSEIIAEAEDHQFFFVVEDADLSISNSDADADGNPIGLSSTVDTGDSSSGSLTVVLRHEPDKSATGVAQGDITNAGGETDIEATFDVVIQ